MTPIREDDLRRVLSVRDATAPTAGADLARAAIRSGHRTRLRRGIAAGTTVAALAVAAAVALPLVPRSIDSVPIPPATSSPTPTQEPSTPPPRAVYSALDTLPASWGDTASLRFDDTREAWPPLDLTLACQPDGFTGTPPFTFPALADLKGGRSQAGSTKDETAPGGTASALLFFDADAAAQFMAELTQQAEGCVGDDAAAGDGTRSRWSVEAHPDGSLLITMLPEFFNGTDWELLRPGSADLILVERSGDTVALAGGHVEPDDGLTADEKVLELAQVVDGVLGR
ncbi:MAG: hypothetical protein QM713_13795 [Arachnia sp.]